MYGDPSLYKAAYEKSLIKSRLKAIKESQEEHTLTPEEVYEGKIMKWRSGKPIDMGYYLCAIVGNNKPSELYWDGSSWRNNDWETLDNNEVAYYMYLGDIPMPEGW